MDQKSGGQLEQSQSRKTAAELARKKLLAAYNSEAKKDARSGIRAKYMPAPTKILLFPPISLSRKTLPQIGKNIIAPGRITIKNITAIIIPRLPNPI